MRSGQWSGQKLPNLAISDHIRVLEMKLKQGGGDESSLKALINEVILLSGYNNDSCHLLSIYCVPYTLKNFMYII